MVMLLHESEPISLMATKTNSDDDDLFEFFCTAAATPELCAADDVIIGGKLLPMWAPPPPKPRKSQAHVPGSSELDHRRSSSLGGSQPPALPENTRAETRRWSSLGDRPGVSSDGKISGDWEHRKLNRVSKQKPERPRETQQQQQAKWRPPRWHVLVFGPVGINPSGMDIKQIHIRQHRRKEAAAAAKDSGEWGPWKLVQSLSCKGVEAVNIVT